MALPTFDNGYFQVTALSISPAVVAVGETATLSITIKNVSGKNITKCYVYQSGGYPSSDNQYGGSFPSGFIYGGGGSSGWDLKDITWNHNASKTFSATISFAEGYYPLDDSNYVLSASQAYIYIGITTNATFANGGNYDNLYIRSTDGYLSILSKRDKPRLTFAIERTPTDEDANVKITARLTADGDSPNLTRSSPAYTAKLYYTNAHDPALTTDSAVTVNISTLITGVVNSTTLVSATFTSASDWYFLLRATNGYETASAYGSIPRAFANVHLAGFSTGGVAFGKFSGATENNPLFECEFPARLNGGFDAVGKVASSRAALGMQSGYVPAVGNTSSNSYKDIAVTFEQPFAVGTTPIVLTSFSTQSTAGYFGRCCVAACAVFNTGFTMRFYNGDSSNRNPSFFWLAIGTTENGQE